MPFVPNKLGVVKVPGKLKDHEMVSIFSPKTFPRNDMGPQFGAGGRVFVRPGARRPLFSS